MGDRPNRSAVDVLIELLEKVPDASTVEILLEPEHLLVLLRAHGWADADIRRDLTQKGRLPGDLLLAVLAKQPDPAVLLDLLGNPAPRPPAPAAPRPAAASTTASRGGSRPVGRVIFGLMLAVPSGWFLFVRLEVLRVPGLIVHFPGAYTLLFSALVGGMLLIGSGVRTLLRGGPTR